MKKYELTIKELLKLCKDFKIYCYNNDNSYYIKNWLDENLKNENNYNYECDCLGELKKKKKYV